MPNDQNPTDPKPNDQKPIDFWREFDLRFIQSSNSVYMIVCNVYAWMYVCMIVCACRQVACMYEYACMHNILINPAPSHPTSKPQTNMKSLPSESLFLSCAVGLLDGNWIKSEERKIT